MWILLIVTLYNVLPVILAQFDIINEDIGDFHYHAKLGKLPLKYEPLSKQDQKASDKAADVIDLIQLVPKIDPLNIPSLPPLGIDVPFLWLSGTVYIENFVLTGVKQIKLHGLELRLINLRADLNITIPQIYFEADFRLQASITYIPVIVKCHVSANLFDVGISVSSGSYKAQAPPTGKVLQIYSAEVKVDIRDVVFNLTNIVIGDEEEKEVIHSPVTQLFSKSSSTSGGNLFDRVLKTAIAKANKELLKISVELFEEYLLSD